MSTVIRIAAERSGCFARRLGNVGEPPEERSLAAWDEVCVSAGHAGRIVRCTSGRGYAISEGPRIVRVFYTHRGRRVGPISNFLLPGQAVELGLGEGVTWEFEEVS